VTQPRPGPTAAPPAPPAGASSGALWSAFALVHVWTAVVGVGLLRSAAFHDVELYRLWVSTGVLVGHWPVLDADWVYPVGALLPMLALLGWAGAAVPYALAWAGLVTALDAAAVVVLLRTTPAGPAGAWWWIAATLALGPVAIGRLDGLVAPLTVLALAVAARRPAVASALLTAGAWIKVAPGGALLALAAAARRPLRRVLVPAAVLSTAVVVLALALGAGPRVASFLGAQGTRGLQVEAVAATPYSLARLWDPGITAELNREINTFEITGVDTSVVTTALDVALLGAVAALTWLAARARRVRAAGQGGAEVDVTVLVLASFALALALIVFNKVGSPQYLSWLLPPVTVALAVGGWRDPWRYPAVVLLVAAALTQWVFPLEYLDFIWAVPHVVVVEAIRNVLLVALLGWATVALWRTSR
jgi:hypothetical protein